MLQTRLRLCALIAALAAPMTFAHDEELLALAPSCGVPSDAPFGTEGALVRVVTLESDLNNLIENPAITDRSGSGTLHIVIRLERASATSATPSRALVNAVFNFTVQQDETVTASHIHTGLPGVNGAILLPLNPAARFDLAANAPGVIRYQAEITDLPTLNSILAIVSDPQDFYANIHTVSKPGGIMRGQMHNAPADDIACMRSAIGALGTDLASVQSDLTGVAVGAASVVSTVGAIRADITSLKTSAASLQTDVTAIKNASATGGLGSLDTNLKTALRLIVQIAYAEGVVGSADRDALLSALK